MGRSSILSWKLIAITEVLCHVCIANENLIVDWFWLFLVDWFWLFLAVINFGYCLTSTNPYGPSILESHFIIEKKA